MKTDINTYLTFKIGTHSFGVNVGKVLEISEYKEPRSVPESPIYMPGVIEYREQVIPLIDTAVKFGLPSIQINDTTCIIVLDLINSELSKKFKVAIIVDAVSDVFEATDNQLMALNDDYRPGYIAGSFKSEKGLVLMMDADMIFSNKDIISIEEVVSNL
jgi:purine-binding chemotaxis protein CheW